ncbi:hypothetical protein DSO57_1038232 [Entomophthora muscae]|uniref:Uncharacterized protein n=1 Tax=Entomophthora muscae TaxID=34485 RepID=A0ACC2T9J7_9FUNG|nr:hypothetical protein DSO57_1038232 [Entomophthora muscae]
MVYPTNWDSATLTKKRGEVHHHVYPNHLDTLVVNSLPPLALDRTIFPRRTKKSAQKPVKPLNSLEDLAHTIDERFVMTYPSQVTIFWLGPVHT